MCALFWVDYLLWTLKLDCCYPPHPQPIPGKGVRSIMILISKSFLWPPICVSAYHLYSIDDLITCYWKKMQPFGTSFQLEENWVWNLITWFTLAGIFLHGVDRFNEESEHHATRIDKSNTTPLLEDKTADTAEASA